MSSLAKVAVEKKVAEFFDADIYKTPSKRFTIFQMQGMIGRAYTVTRNALNQLTREGKCDRKVLCNDGTYGYIFHRPVPKANG